MKRGVIHWLLLLSCIFLILGAMGWMTTSVLQAEKNRLTAEAQADIEERKRTAISRMDSLASSFLLIENQRPPAHYRTVNKLNGKLAISPILAEKKPLAKLYFELNAVAALTCPQVPEGNLRELAIKRGVSPEQLKTHEESMRTLSILLNERSRSEAHVKMTPLESMCFDLHQVRANWNNEDALPEPEKAAPKGDERQGKKQKEIFEPPQLVQKRRSQNSKGTRAAVYDEANRDAVGNNVLAQNLTWGAQGEEEILISLDTFAPVWMGEELAVARQVRTNRETKIQGIWLDQEILTANLLAVTRDLFAEGSLEKIALPAVDLPELMITRLQEATQDPHVLVSLPFRFECGEAAEVIVPSWSPLRKSLLVGWIAAVFALLAVLVLVGGIMKLSSRRAAFVSSVTHELRTPLTTFRLYSEMLADGMVKDEEKKNEYLRTMLGESERLNHLVENVLAYSQIEKGSARRKKERLTLESFLGKLTPLLERRIAQEGAHLKMNNLLEEKGDREVEIDVTSVEQIIFNLVDNACKYGMPQEGEREVKIEIEERGGKLLFTVCDNGKGIEPAERRRLFRAFHKSAQDAAESKPGVGLGLALCRRLAKAMGGDLNLEEKNEKGASFVLSLPS